MDDRSQNRADTIRAVLQMVGGVVLIAAGVVVSVATLDAADGSPGSYSLAFGPICIGVVLFLRGLLPLLGYKSFVAWRYLLVHHQKVTRRTKLGISSMFLVRLAIWLIAGVSMEPKLDAHDPWQLAALASTVVFLGVVFWGVLRYSKPSTFAFLFGVALAVVSWVGIFLIARHKLTFLSFEEDRQRQVLQVLGICQLAGGGLAFLAAFFGSLRAFFTFFTTVPIGGVWIGTAALVCVLSVMSGFESDLREKILGSNAHIQITREDGDFVEWRAAKAKIDKVPGVVASTPFAVSEVVIAAHNNGMNVIIKGIDPKTVGTVTDLVNDLEDREAMTRLEPLVEDVHDLTVPQRPHQAGGIDPAPPDLPSGGDPIDFSAPAPTPDGGVEAAPAVPMHPDGSDVQLEGAYGGEAAPLVHEPRTKLPDPPPDDLVITDEPPIDYSGRDDDTAISVIDVPEPTLSRRTQALPGVLVGRELVKQTHLYTGEEVRVVSPLSDPSNPDATGTPIPFNRDYRVAGIFYTGMYEYDLKYVYVTLDSLQDFLDRGDAVDGIEVRITNADDTEAFVPRLHEALGPGYRIQDWHELNRSLFSALKLEKVAMFLVLGIVILVASFSIVGNLIMVVVEKAREIALLKTLGASDAGVMQLFAIQGLLIGLIGTALGIATGLVACWAGKRFGLPLNPDVYYIDRLPIHVDPQSVAAAAAAGVFISIAATLYPALLAARVRPAAGMRH